MRKLKTSDVLRFCRLLKKVGVKEEIKNIAKKSDNAKDVWDQGFDLLWSIFERVTNAKSEAALYEFLAGPFEMSGQEVADLSLPDLIENIKVLAKENDLSGFFGSAAGLMKSN